MCAFFCYVHNEWILSSEIDTVCFQYVSLAPRVIVKQLYMGEADSVLCRSSLASTDIKYKYQQILLTFFLQPVGVMAHVQLVDVSVVVEVTDCFSFFLPFPVPFYIAKPQRYSWTM